MHYFDVARCCTAEDKITSIQHEYSWNCYSKIVRFVNFDHFYCRWRSWCRQCICLSKEISDRKRVLNEMFLAMLADIEWFEKVNALLCALTQRLYTYAGMLYRKTIEWRSSRSRILRRKRNRIADDFFFIWEFW